MIDVNKSGQSMTHGPGGAGEKKHRRPSLRAELFLLAKQGWEEAVESSIPDQLTVRTYTEYEAFLEDLSGKVAVAVLDPALADEKLREAIARTISQSAHARIALLATDGAQLLRCEVPHDESFVFPEEAKRFESAIKRLYVRSYYAATLERYYKVCFSIRNREIQLDSEEIERDEEVQRLREALDVLRSHLKQFRRVLKPEDIEAMADREERLESLAESSKNSSSPGAVGLPDACPNCGIDWTVWHGARLRNGYERIGANTWRCVKCGTIMADNDPDNYRLA